MHPPRVLSALGFLLRPRTTGRAIQARWVHGQSNVPQIPSPIPLVPDVQTFLTVIGRGLKQHVAKIPTWEALFTLTSPQLKELGIEPVRTRRYLLRWRQKFRLGQFGIGGDFKYVDNGVADLRVQEVQTDPLNLVKYVVNVPAGKSLEEVPEEERLRVRGYKVKKAHAIGGPYALQMQGRTGSRVTVTEGMWEDVRGRKIDGGERRRAEVRFKKHAAERKEARERAGFNY